MIDLLSDTLTRPTQAMRQAMVAAPVGDDVFDEDPTVHALQEHVAALLGHEAGLFVVTGSIGNQLGVAAHVRPGQEVLCDSGAHIARAELGAHGVLHGATMRTWVTADGVVDVDQVAHLLAPDAGPYLVSTACVALENTHNFGGGTVQPLESLQAVHALCRDAGVRLHLDGARLWNAHVATGVPLQTYGRLFDTVNVCLSKGLGAPVGSVLVGSREVIAGARLLRKRLGAGWRQAGMLAAAGLYALDHHVDRLAGDHAAARAFADAVGRHGVRVTNPPTNIVVVETGARPAKQVVADAAAHGVRISAVGPRVVRAVTHLDVTAEECAEAGDVVGALLAP